VGSSPTRPTVQVCDLRKRLIKGADSGLWVNGLNPLLATSTAVGAAEVHDALTWVDVWGQGRGEPDSSVGTGLGRPSWDADGTQGEGKGLLRWPCPGMNSGVGVMPGEMAVAAPGSLPLHVLTEGDGAGASVRPVRVRPAGRQA
jgi:hypothetical protein